MTIAFGCVFIAGVLPIVWAGFAKFKTGFKLENNLNPRDLLAKATGAAQRAKWAHDNSWEAFAPFAAAVIIASMSGVEQSLIDQCAIIFIVARVLYGVVYIANLSLLRSAIWSVGFFCIVALYYFSWMLNS